MSAINIRLALEAWADNGNLDRDHIPEIAREIAALSTLPIAGEGKAELYTKLVAFLGKVQGVSMGVAMSGKDHPNPDGALMDLFNDAQELYQEHLAAPSSPGKDGGQKVGTGTEWTYQIQYGPESEANYAWVYRAQEMVATMKTHHAQALCSALSIAKDSWQGVEAQHG